MKTIFLDRDGVINHHPSYMGYVQMWAEFNFIPNARSAIRELTKNGYRIFVITNQAGIGRGLYSEETLRDIHCRMITEISDAGGAIEAVYYCPHHPDAGCECRKPKPGMLKRAAQEHDIDLSRAYFIGDSTTDIQAGRRAGTKTFLVLTGYGCESYNEYINAEYYRCRNREECHPDRIFTNLYTATRWLLNNDF